MLKSCLTPLLVAAGIWGALFGVLYGKLDTTLAAAGSGATVLFGLFLSGFLYRAHDNRRKQRLIGRSLAGTRPRDGEMMAAIGPIRPEGEPLRAPISGQECVAYEYTLRGSAGSGSPPSQFKGIALTPAKIQTQWGAIQLLSFPDLEDFPKRQLVDDGSHSDYPKRELIDDESRARARAFLERTSFESVGLSSAVRFVKEVMTDDDGSVRKDMRIRGSGEPGELWSLEEQCVPVGAEVCAFGAYAAARGGLVADLSRQGTGVQLYRNELERMGAHFGRVARSDTISFVGIFTLLCAMTWGIVAAMQSQKSSQESARRERELISAAQRGDEAAVGAALSAGLNPNILDDAGQPLLLTVRDAATAQVLIAAGAQLEWADSRGSTALINAALHNRVEVAETLIAAGANVRARNTAGETALDICRRLKRREIERLLLEAGAGDEGTAAQQ